MVKEIEALIENLEVIDSGDEKGLARVINCVVEARLKDSTVRIYRVMKRSGVGGEWKVDEYVAKVLSRGLRRFGEVELGNEVECEFSWAGRGYFVNSS